jgi:hypothetical protein
MESQHVRTKPVNNSLGIVFARTIEQRILVSIRWVLTTTWFLLLLSAVFVGTSLVASLYTDAWHWFQRSGALMVSIGAVLSTRRPLGLILESILDARGLRRSSQFRDASNQDEANELKTCLCGFIMVAMGTLIWAYGDLVGCLLYWNASCLS